MDDYVNIDNDLPTMEIVTDEEIISSVLDQGKNKGSEEKDGDEVENILPPTSMQVRDACRVIKMYLHSQSESHQELDAFLSIENFIIKK